MQDHALPLLHISSKYNGLVKINESAAGETGGNVITMPVTPNGTFYLSFCPLENPEGQMVMPVTRKLCIGRNAGAGNDGAMRICVWPDNVYEIEIDPPVIRLPAKDEVYFREYGAFEFQANQRQYAASVVHDFGCYLMIEDAIRRRTMYAIPLPFRVESVRISLNRLEGTPYLLADGVCEKGAFVVAAALSPQMKAVACEVCEAFETDAQELRTIVRPDEGNYKIKRVYGLKEGELRLLREEAMLAESAGRSPEETVRDFLYCLQHDLDEQAMNCLSMSLREGLTIGDLKGFFGDFYAPSPPLMPPRDCRETLWALKYRGEGGLFHARLFCFEMFRTRDGRHTIDNIREP